MNTNHLKHIALALVLTMGSVGCGADSGELDPNGNPIGGNLGGNGNVASKTAELALVAAHKLPTIMSLTAYQGRSLVAGGIWHATVQSGMAGWGVTKTGTLTQVMPGVLQYSYSPSPQDKMVIVLSDGTRHEITISKVEGNLVSPSPEAFLGANHVLAYRHVIPGQADLQMETANVNGQWTSSAKGTFTWDKTPYTANVQAFGSYLFENDMSGTENKTNYTVRGTVSTTGFSIDIDETHYFHLVTAKGAKYGPVTHSIDTNNNTLTVGDDVFKWVNCQTTKVFRNGKPSVNDPWAASGQVLRNGQAWGAYQYVAQLMTSNGAQRQFQLVTSDGTVVLESWNDF